MKCNFIVSDYRKLWIEGATCLYIVEPYVYYQLKKDGHILDYNDVAVASNRRKTSSDLEKDYESVKLKFDKYSIILAERLNQIHGTRYSLPFWKRALSIPFERYITLVHDVFENCESYFNADKHDCRVLSKESYHIPLDFEDQRSLFQHTDYGQEQIFSIYMHAFHPTGLKTKDDRFKASTNGSLKLPAVFRLLTRGLSRGVLEKAEREFLKKRYARSPHKIGIMGAFFSTKNLNLLMRKSKGAIYPVPWQANLKSDDGFFGDKRKFLSGEQRGFDKFDRLFFASIEHCLPQIFVENFKEVERYYNAYFDGYRNLEYIVSEAWLSSSSLCIALALLKERGVRHVYNEHNYLEYPWVGSLVRREAELSDIFVSLGWHSDKIPNMLKGASLFEFALDRQLKKRHKICYISGDPLVKKAHYTASYGHGAEDTLKYLNFVRSFFAALSAETRAEILFRGYPPSKSQNVLRYDQDFMSYPYLRHVRKSEERGVSGKTLMLQSDLVVVDYLSTPHLEALMMNIPTIFFWNPAANYLAKDHSDFFESLISVGICQTEPVKAAKFVESVKDHPNNWWCQEAVQKAKDDFLRRNIGKPEVMIDFLLSLLKSEGDLRSHKDIV